MFLITVLSTYDNCILFEIYMLCYRYFKFIWIFIFYFVDFCSKTALNEVDANKVSSFKSKLQRIF